MGPGHLGVAFAMKPSAQKAPLLALLLASELLDLLSFGFAALGLERHGVSQTDLAGGVQILEPSSLAWSHGLLMAAAWSALAGGLAFAALRDRRSGAVTALVVFSHWVLDFIVHPPELPLLFAGSPQVGLGLWSSGPGLIANGVLEALLLGGGLAIYLRSKGVFSRRPARHKESVS
jgi:hypothetical protein